MQQSVLAVCDELRAAANKAADLLEKIESDNETMRGASAGVLPDGTPVEDMIEELNQAKIDLAKMHVIVRQAKRVALCKTSERAEEIVNLRKLLCL